MDYFSEAFQQLNNIDLLESESFELTTDGIDDLQDYLDSSDAAMAKVEDDDITVIDPTVDENDELAKSYNGMTILLCNACHTLIYKDPTEVGDIEDEADVCEDQMCPYCCSYAGYTLVGKVAPYVSSDVSVSVNGGRPQTFTRDAFADGVTIEDEDADEFFFNDEEGDDLMESYRRGRKRKTKYTFNESLVNSGDKVKFTYTTKDGISNTFDWTADQAYNDKTSLYKAVEPAIEEDDPDFKSIATFTTTADIAEAYANRYMESCAKENCDGAECESDDSCDKSGKCGKGKKDEILLETDDDTEDLEEGYFSNGYYSRPKNRNYRRNRYTEGFDEVTVKTDGRKLSMKRDGDATEIREEPAEDMATDDSMIVPYDNNDFEEPDDFVDTEVEANDFGFDDEEADFGFDDEEGDMFDFSSEFDDEEGDYDFDVEDMNEEATDEVVESYLRNTYNNVKSFRTTNITEDHNGKLVVEGLIKFDNGNSYKTSFKFTGLTISESGKCTFAGLNEHLRHGTAFRLTGKIVNKTLIPESLVAKTKVYRGSRTTVERTSGILSESMRFEAYNEAR